MNSSIEPITSNANVLVITSSFPRNPESFEGNFVLELCGRLDSSGYRSLVIAPHYSGGISREIWSPVRIIRFRYFFPSCFEKLAYGSGMAYNIRKNPLLIFTVPFFLLSEFLYSYLAIRKNPISLIHTHWLIPQGLIGAIFHQIKKIPHVATIHGSDLAVINKNKVLKPLCRYIVNHSDVVTVNSSYNQKLLELVVPGSAVKTRIIPMGIDPEQFSGKYPDMKKRFNANYLILSVGRLIDLKGIIYLIDSIPDILEKKPGTHLVVIGDGPEKTELEKRALNLGIEPNVHFLGTVNHEKLFPWYHSADVFILPSIIKDGKTEGLGVVLLEAMASGCPVIGSNAGGISDIITDGENGFLVPEKDSNMLAEKIILILSDGVVKEKLRKNGLLRVKECFSWDRIVNSFSAVYRDIEKLIN